MTGILHAVAAFLLALSGYSALVVLTASGRRRRPAGWELPVAGATAVAAAAGALPLPTGWLALPAALGCGAVVGLVVGGAARAVGRRPPAGSRRTREEPDADLGTGGGPRGFLLRLGTYQGQLTLGLLYFVLLAPFALLMRLRDGRPSGGDGERATHWLDRPTDGTSGTEADLRRQS